MKNFVSFYQRLCILILSILFATAVFAQTDTQRENLQNAAKLVESINQGDNNTATFYNAACYFALGGKPDEAFAYLEKAIEHDYTNAAHLKEDADLISLRDDRRWKLIVAKTEAKKSEIESAFYNRKDFWDNSALKTTYRENLNEDEKIAGLSKFWSEAKYNFVNFDLVPDVNWDALYLSYLPKVRQTKTTLEYYKVLMEFCAKLHDGHTNIHAPAELSDELYARPLLRTGLFEDKVLITDVLDDSLRQNGIEKGLEITEINGTAVKKYAEETFKPFLSASTAQDLETRMFDYNLLAGAIKNPVELTLRDVKGNIFKKIVARVSVREQIKKAPSFQTFEFKMLPNNIAYVALNSFEDNSAAEMFAAKYDEISKADAIIFDVRENGGGNSSVGWTILGFLTDQPFATSKWYTRQYRPSFRAWERPQGVFGDNQKWQPNGKKIYTKPVVVLTSPRTFSAAEDFTLAFDILKRGKIIGEATGGSSGQPLSFSLPGGGSARVCTKRDQFPDGRDFVGKGILPDKIVKPTVADFRAGRDTVLEAAVKEVKK